MFFKAGITHGQILLFILTAFQDCGSELRGEVRLQQRQVSVAAGARGADRGGGG